jgi:Na+/proline symporter
LVVAIVLMSAVYAFASGRHHVTAVLIGIATALKVTPVLFVLLFVRKGTRRGVISLVISASMATIAGAFLVGGLDNIANYSTALGASQDAGQRVNENLLPNN